MKLLKRQKVFVKPISTYVTKEPLITCSDKETKGIVIFFSLLAQLTILYVLVVYVIIPAFSLYSN